MFKYNLQEDYLSPEQQRAIIYPGLEKPSLNLDDLANYLSYLEYSFVSKLLERAVHIHLLMYLNENELLPSVPSAYQQFFSMETAVLFDLSAAFDMVDHAILLKRLDVNLVFEVMHWIGSHLTCQ